MLRCIFIRTKFIESALLFLLSILVLAYAQVQQSPTRTRHSGEVISVAFNPRGSIVTSGSQLVVEPKAGRMTAYSRPIALTRDGEVLAGGGWDGIVTLRPSGRQLTQTQFSIGTGGVSSLAFSPNGKLLATGGGKGHVELWMLDPLRALWAAAQSTLIAPLPEGSYSSAQGFKGTAYDVKLFHLGKDYCVDASVDKTGVKLGGTPFYAIRPGTVVASRFSEPAYRADGVGNYIVIDHGNQLVAVYMHLAKVFVRTDQLVDSNTPLGEAGDVVLHPPRNCGHLHLEIRSNGVTSLNVAPNLRYSYASRDGKTRYSRPLGDERAVNAWIDSNFLDPDVVLKSRRVAAKPTAVMRNQLGMELVYVPPGSFMMGSNNRRADEKPMHRVMIKEGFYMGTYEVTQAEWQQVMGSTVQQQRDPNVLGVLCEGRQFPPTVGEGDKYPMYYVSWYEAQEFIRRLNGRNDGFVYRLPSEAEWEYACRAGTTGDYGGNLDSIAWYEHNSGCHTHLVGTKQPNAFGLYDMHGNVREWCEDWYHDTYTGAPTDGSAWLSGGDQKYRVSRGGAWGISASYLRSASRDRLVPGGGGSDYGLRVVAMVKSP